MSLCRILPISLNCAMPVIPSQVAFEFAIKFSSGRLHQLTRDDVERKTRQRVSSSTPNNLVAEIASAGLSPQRSSYYVEKGFDSHTKGGAPGRLPLYIRGCYRIMSKKVSIHIRKEVPPAASPSTLEDVAGGNQYAVHGFSRCA